MAVKYRTVDPHGKSTFYFTSTTSISIDYILFVLLFTISL